MGCPRSRRSCETWDEALGTFYATRTRQSRHMRRHKSIIVILAAVVVGGAIVYVRLGPVSYFVRSRTAIVERNGTIFPGEVLDGRATAIVTIRTPGANHSYQLLFTGDVDFIGDVGQVFDCREWVAPKVPILIETPAYPPCRKIPASPAQFERRSMTRVANGVEFLTPDGSTITVRW